MKPLSAMLSFFPLMFACSSNGVSGPPEGRAAGSEIEEESAQRQGKVLDPCSEKVVVRRLGVIPADEDVANVSVPGQSPADIADRALSDALFRLAEETKLSGVSVSTGNWQAHRTGHEAALLSGASRAGLDEVGLSRAISSVWVDATRESSDSERRIALVLTGAYAAAVNGVETWILTAEWEWQGRPGDKEKPLTHIRAWAVRNADGAIVTMKTSD